MKIHTQLATYMNLKTKPFFPYHIYSVVIYNFAVMEFCVDVNWKLNSFSFNFVLRTRKKKYWAVWSQSKKFEHATGWSIFRLSFHAGSFSLTFLRHLPELRKCSMISWSGLLEENEIIKLNQGINKTFTLGQTVKIPWLSFFFLKFSNFSDHFTFHFPWPFPDFPDFHDARLVNITYIFKDKGHLCCLRKSHFCQA